MDGDDRLGNETHVKVLFFILTRIDGKSKKIDMNTEEIDDD